jgi:hypothetical protein
MVLGTKNHLMDFRMNWPQEETRRPAISSPHVPIEPFMITIYSNGSGSPGLETYPVSKSAGLDIPCTLLLEEIMPQEDGLERMICNRLDGFLQQTVDINNLGSDNSPINVQGYYVGTPIHIRTMRSTSRLRIPVIRITIRHKYSSIYPLLTCPY